MTRRELLTGALAAGGSASVARPAGETLSAGQGGRTSDEQVAAALHEIRDELHQWRGAWNAVDCAEAGTLRALQRAFLRTRGKFPDFIEVGIDVWERIGDWQVRSRLPSPIGRLADGHYTLPFGQTLLVLRHDVSTTYVGEGYDK